VVLENLCMGCMGEKGEQQECPLCGFNETVAEEVPYYLPPRTILQDKYIIGRVLGQGGFAITYLAWDINLGIRLAIKEYFPLDLVYRNPENNFVIAHSNSQETIFVQDMEKFLQEARILARFMEHPNIVSVTDFFQANRTAYLVMHYIEGVTLREHLRTVGEKIPFGIAMEIFMPVMDALRAIHEAGLLHRDISPENIIISQSGRVLLIDFGAARRSAGDRDDNISVVMKPGYTPQEQYKSKGKQGAWTDVYAAAATIYRAITGQMLTNSLDRLEKDTLVPPSKLGVDMKPEAEKAVLKALSVDPADRYQSMAEFQEELMQIDLPPQKPPSETGLDTGKTSVEEETSKEEIKQEPPSERPEVKKSERAYTVLGDINIGRAADNDIVLNNDTVSRYHVRIYSRYQKWYIADLDSTHGTYVNEHKIEKSVELKAPSQVRVSDIILKYDGSNILSENGLIAHKLNEHVSFTERWLNSEKLSPVRLIDNFLASLDKITQPNLNAKEHITVNIGRLADNDVVLSNEMISRYHVRLFLHSGKWYVADLQSTHGTKVNDTPVKEPVVLNPGDTISISDIPIHFNGGSIFTEEGEVLYVLPEQASNSNSQNPDNESLLNQLQEALMEPNILIAIMAVAGFLIIVFLIVLILN